MLRLLFALMFIPLSLHAYETKNFDLADLEGEGQISPGFVYNKTAITFRARVREYKDRIAPDAPEGISLIVSDGYNQFTVVTGKNGHIEWTEHHQIPPHFKDMSWFKAFTFPRYIVAQAPLRGVEHLQVGLGYKNGQFWVFQELEEPFPFLVQKRQNQFKFDDFIQ